MIFHRTTECFYISHCADGAGSYLLKIFYNSSVENRCTPDKIYCTSTVPSYLLPWCVSITPYPVSLYIYLTILSLFSVLFQSFTLPFPYYLFVSPDLLVSTSITTCHQPPPGYISICASYPCISLHVCTNNISPCSLPSLCLFPLT